MRTLTEHSQKPSVVRSDTYSEAYAGFLRAFSALRHRNFRLFWSGQLISQSGTWMQSIGQSWLVLQLSRDPWLLGVVGALQFLPVMLFSLFGGVFADRFPKRRVLLFTQSAAMLQAFLLWMLTATHTVQIWHVMVLALALGFTNVFDMPARQSFVMDMVGREDLPNAVALNSSTFNMARIVGPGIGGLLIFWLGVPPLFLINALSFIAVLICLFMMDPSKFYQQHVQQVKQKTLKSVREGLAYSMKTPSVFLIIAVVGMISLFGINFNVMLPLFATNVLHAGSQGYGFISSAFGIGSLLSALWIAWGNKKPDLKQMLIASMFFSITEILFALSHWYIVSLMLIATVGFAQIAFTAVANTTVQSVAPDHLRGRVMSVYMLVFAGTIPIGNLIMGALSSQFGAPIALMIGGGISLIAAVVGWFSRKPAEKDLARALQIF